jgi:hypothetical protein
MVKLIVLLIDSKVLAGYQMDGGSFSAGEIHIEIICNFR